MKIIRVKQNSEEWLELRQGKITGSKLNKIYPKTIPPKPLLLEYSQKVGLPTTKPSPTKNDPNKTKDLTVAELLGQLTPEDIGKIKTEGDKKDEFYKLVAERVARPLTLNDYVDLVPEGVETTPMLRGHLLEPEAIAKFAKKYNKTVETGDIVWLDEENDQLMISPDGTIFEDGKPVEAVEVKCLASYKVIRAFDEQKYPDEYEEQVRQYFIVNPDLRKLYFVIYTDLIPSLELQVFEIERSEVEADLRELRTFSEEIMAQVEALAAKIAF